VRLFISYSSQDRAVAEPLAATLRRDGLQVWIDEQLGAGEMGWWAAVLEQIRGCEVFALALSEHSLNSKPCQAELAYAQALRRPILPMQIGPIGTMRANPVADRHIIDYQQPTPEAGIELIGAVHTLAAQAPPLPDPLPAEPPFPFGYLIRLAATVDGPELDPREQTLLLAELKAGLDADGADPIARRGIAELLRRLHDRPDITPSTTTDVDSLLAGLNTTALPARSTNKRAFAGIAAAALVAIATIIAVVASTTTPAEQTASPTSIPAVAPERLDAVLLTDPEINTIMGSTTLEHSESIRHVMGATPNDLSNPECLGALFAAQEAVYQRTGYSATSTEVLVDPKDQFEHSVVQTATIYPSADMARVFVNNSAPKWTACRGQTVSITIETPSHYTFGEVVGSPPHLTQSYTLEGTVSYTCQRVLRAVSNLVIDGTVCGNHISNEGNQIADQIAAKVAQ
jgi:hypothetical protein